MQTPVYIGPQPINNIRIKSHFSNWHSLTNLSIIDKEARLIYNFEISSETDSNNVILKDPFRKDYPERSNLDHGITRFSGDKS